MGRFFSLFRLLGFSCFGASIRLQGNQDMTRRTAVRSTIGLEVRALDRHCLDWTRHRAADRRL
jgi:hypothetical protein